MYLTYNGIPLEIVHFVNFSEKAVYSPDGKDYLYTHFSITIRGVCNPGANSDGADWLVAFRRLLLAPRKQLVVSIPAGAGSTTILRSPLTRPDGVTSYVCDANNGPTPLALDVVAVIGDKTMIVEYSIETWVNECTTARPLLSHRWHSRADLDSQFFTTRTISGEAYFRSDAMYGAGGPPVYADDYRGSLAGAHLVPRNFQRTDVITEVASDGLSLKYTIIDKQKKLTIDQASFNRIANIEATFHQGHDRGNAWRAVRRVWGGWAAGLAGGLAAAMPGAMAAFGAMNPEMRTTLTIDVWGTPLATSKDLVFAIGFAAATCNLGSPILFPGGLGFAGGIINYCFTGADVTVDLHHPHATGTLTFRSSAVTHQLLSVMGLGPPLITNPPNDFPGMAIARGIDDPNAITTNPPRDNASRGIWSAHLAAQGLQATCSAPARPVPAAYVGSVESYNLARPERDPST